MRNYSTLVCIYGTLFFKIIHPNYSLHLFYMVSEPNNDILYNIGSGAPLFEYFWWLLSIKINRRNLILGFPRLPICKMLFLRVIVLLLSDSVTKSGISNSALNLSVVTRCGDWIIDSGATDHMSCDPHKFINFIFPLIVLKLLLLMLMGSHLLLKV